MRNRINTVLSTHFGDDWYDTLPLGALERQQIQKAKNSITKERKAISNARVIAAANFGLWVNLFNGPYEELWRKCLRKAFAEHPHTLERKRIRKDLAGIHRLRNRIAHYEPIIDLDTDALKRSIITMVQWMDASIVTYVQ